MPALSSEERLLAERLSRLTYSNPFLPERVALEREILGDGFVDVGSVWNIRVDFESESPNLERLGRTVEHLVERLRDRLAATSRGWGEDELSLYEDLVLYHLYHRNREHFERLTARSRGKGFHRERVSFYEKLEEETARYLGIPGVRFSMPADPPHLFAIFFQIRRAFHHIFAHIVGGSMPAARLRAAVWQSIFTHDIRRYRRALAHCLGDFTTLISGPTGTGKELVARAIALSRYVAFDPQSQTFAEHFAESFYPLNLSALSPTLIESELFGHRKGAFTGAVADHAGWLEVCRPFGTVFLDEIGETDTQIQVKLLRVLQSRTFQRIGDTQPRHFHGKIIAATNRDLALEMRARRFREDLYYRLCSDLIVAPSLEEQLRASPEELPNLVRFIARRLVGEEGDALANEVLGWIEAELGRDYPWPRNVRELEQCVRNVLIRREYRPPEAGRKGSARDDLAHAVAAGTLTADELLRRYCTLIYFQTGSYEETARRLVLDRRTVKSRIDPAMLESLRSCE